MLFICNRLFNLTLLEKWSLLNIKLRKPVLAYYSKGIPLLSRAELIPDGFWSGRINDYVKWPISELHSDNPLEEGLTHSHMCSQSWDLDTICCGLWMHQVVKII